MTLEWASVAGAARLLRSNVTEVLAQQELGNVGEFTVVRVSPAPDSWVELDLSPPREGARVTLLGHPKARSLEASAPGEIQRSESLGNPSRAFFHAAGNESGNRGGPVIDVRTLRAVGVHLGQSGQAMSFLHPPLLQVLRQIGLAAPG